MGENVAPRNEKFLCSGSLEYSEDTDVARVSLTSHRAFTLVVPVSEMEILPKLRPLEGPQR